MIPATPVHGGTVGFAAGRVAFCNGCGWRGVATYSGDQLRPRRRLRARRLVTTALNFALTYCPSCQHEPDTQSRARERQRDPSKGKRKAARAARRRNR